MDYFSYVTGIDISKHNLLLTDGIKKLFTFVFVLIKHSHMLLYCVDNVENFISPAKRIS